MGCDKSLTDDDHIVQYDEKECFGAFFGLRADGHDGLPSLAIYKSDHLDIDERHNELCIYRQAAAGLAYAAPIGVIFAHSLTNGDHKGFSIRQVERAKNAILVGRRAGFHFVTNSGQFPADIRRVIDAANEELKVHGKECISFHVVPKHAYARHLPSLTRQG